MSGRDVSIPVSSIEFKEGGTTLWVHDREGGTTLRIKALGGIKALRCGDGNPLSHCDILIPGSITICLAKNAKEGDPA